MSAIRNRDKFLELGSLKNLSSAGRAIFFSRSELAQILVTNGTAVNGKRYSNRRKEYSAANHLGHHEKLKRTGIHVHTSACALTDGTKAKRDDPESEEIVADAIPQSN